MIETAEKRQRNSRCILIQSAEKDARLKSLELPRPRNQKESVHSGPRNFLLANRIGNFCAFNIFEHEESWIITKRSRKGKWVAVNIPQQCVWRRGKAQAVRQQNSRWGTVITENWNRFQSWKCTIERFTDSSVSLHFYLISSSLFFISCRLISIREWSKAKRKH